MSNHYSQTIKLIFDFFLNYLHCLKFLYIMIVLYAFNRSNSVANCLKNYF